MLVFCIANTTNAAALNEAEISNCQDRDFTVIQPMILILVQIHFCLHAAQIINTALAQKNSNKVQNIFGRVNVLSPAAIGLWPNKRY